MKYYSIYIYIDKTKIIKNIFEENIITLNAYWVKRPIKKGFFKNYGISV